MRLLLASLLVLAGCSTPRPEFSAARPASSAAELGYRGCAYVSMMKLMSKNQQEAALDISRVSEGLCARKRQELLEALQADNPGPYGATFADAYVQGRRTFVVNLLASEVMKQRQ